MFALKKRNQAGLHIFVGLCVLEIKTKASENAASDLAQQVMAEGRNFVVCNAGDEEFKQAILENAYRSQVCQHAAALGSSLYANDINWSARTSCNVENAFLCSM